MARHIKIPTANLTGQIFENEKLLKVYVWCFLKASQEEGTENIFYLSRKSASEELNMSESTVYRLIKTLESEGLILISVNRKVNRKMNSKITLMNPSQTDIPEIGFLKSEQVFEQENEQAQTPKIESKKPINPPGADQEIVSFWNSQKLVFHKRITPKLQISLNRALKLYLKEDIITAIAHYSEMYHDQSYEYCNYLWTLEKFLDDPKGVAYFFDDGQKWINYQEHKKKTQVTAKKKDFDPYEIKRSWE